MGYADAVYCSEAEGFAQEDIPILGKLACDIPRGYTTEQFLIP